MITQKIASVYMKFSRWHFVHEEMPAKAVVIGAPHTSNWDAFFMVMAFWKVGRPIRFLVKDSAVRVPVLGHLLRALGGISTDRSHPRGLVGKLVEEAESSATFTLILAPKGTRSQRKYWRSGFYRIALESGLPVQLGFIDRNTMTYGWGPSIHLSGNVHADMEKIRAFYAGKAGKRPELTSTPRLRLEDE